MKSTLCVEFTKFMLQEGVLHIGTARKPGTGMGLWPRLYSDGFENPWHQ